MPLAGKKQNMQVIRCWSNKSGSAQNSWFTRFIARNKLADHVARYPKTSKTSRSDQDAKAAKRSKTMASSPEKPKPELSSLDRNVKENKGDGSKNSPVVIEEGGHSPAEPSSEQAPAADRSLVCETMTPCYRPDKEQHRLQVIESDLKTVDPKVWLNDTVISYFIREFIEAHKSYNFDGQFFGTILMNYKANKRNIGKTYAASCGITANFPYETYPTILVPVCMDVHWSFVVIQNPVLKIKDLAPVILHVDSMQYHDTDRIHRILGGYFRKDALEKFQVKKITYKVKARKTKPHQDNTYDCGIFMLYFMREVNRAIMRAKGNIILPLFIANICALPKQTRDHFSCDLKRMEFLKLFRNDQAVQSEIANR